MLEERVLKTTSSISLPVPLAPLPNRPDKYKCWVDGRMEKAMAVVKDQGFSVRRAAEEYAIPKSTLHDGYWQEFAVVHRNILLMKRKQNWRDT